MSRAFPSILISALLSLPRLGVCEGPAKAWKDTAEASVVSTNGNSKNTTSAAKNNFTYSWTRAVMELEAGGLGSRSQDRVTAERYFAGEKVSWKASERNYLFEKTRWDKDRFAGIRSRYDASIGYGRELFASSRDSAFVELGPGFILEKRIGAPDNEFASGRGYAKFTHKFSDTAQFTQDGEYLLNFKDSSDSRATTETALIAAINAIFSLKTSYVWRHVSRPAPTFIKDDTTTSIAIIANF